MHSQNTSKMGSGPAKTRLTLQPGQRGARTLSARYGDQLVCVRYRYDEQQKRRFKTVELIVAESGWEPSKPYRQDKSLVHIRVGMPEVEVRRRVKRAGGRWHPQRRVWELRYDRVMEIGLENRIVL